MKIAYKVGTRWNICDISKARFDAAHTADTQSLDFRTFTLGKMRKTKFGDAVLVPELRAEFQNGNANQVRVVGADMEQEIADVDKAIETLQARIAELKVARAKKIEHAFFKGKPLKRVQIAPPHAHPANVLGSSVGNANAVEPSLRGETLENEK